MVIGSMSTQVTLMKNKPHTLPSITITPSRLLPTPDYLTLNHHQPSNLTSEQPPVSTPSTVGSIGLNSDMMTIPTSQPKLDSENTLIVPPNHLNSWSSLKSMSVKTKKESSRRWGSSNRFDYDNYDGVFEWSTYGWAKYDGTL